MGVSPVKPGESPVNTLREVSGARPEKTAESIHNSSSNISFQKISVKNNENVSALLRQTLFSLGLKEDGLNRALLIFSRFFSLDTGKAADPAYLLKELRHEVLSYFADNPDKAENRALAAAAFFDKGIKPGREAMESYVNLLEPDERDSPENTGDGEPQAGAYSFDGNEGGGNSGGQNYSHNGKDRGENGLSAGKLKALFEEFMDPRFLRAGNPGGGKLLSFLNRIPGKNKQRWVVWPFKVTLKGINFNVLLRLLIQEPVSSGRSRMFLDAAGPSLSWSFVLDKTGGETLKAGVSVYPERKAAGLALIKKEVEKFLAVLGPVEVQVSNGGKLRSMADFLKEEVLPSINEEV